MAGAFRSWSDNAAQYLKALPLLLLTTLAVVT